MKAGKIRLKRIDNRGVAMISIMIAVAFITVIASALLYITYSNFRMKTLNIRAKENYYQLDGQLNKIYAGVRNELNGSVSTNPNEKIKSFTVGGTAPTEETPVQYDVRKIAKWAYPEFVSYGLWDDSIGTEILTTHDAQRPSFDELREEKYTGNDQCTYYTKYGDPTAEPYSGMVTVKSDSTKGTTTYTFHDFRMSQKTKDGYVNKIKTDIEFTTIKKTGTSEEGGIGDFSMLSDSSIGIASEKFCTLDIYGNCYFSSTSGLGDYENSKGEKVKYTAPGTNAVELDSEAKVNVVGKYMVVYGDLVLNDQSCLYIGDGNLTVYGNIIINDDAMLICNGTLYMVEGNLPGRTTESDIIINKNNKDDHVYPHSLSITRLTKEQYESFAGTLGFSNDDLTDDGITEKIIKTIKMNGKDFNILEFKGNINGVTDGCANGGYTSYYGQPIGVNINSNTAQINKDFCNKIVFNRYFGPNYAKPGAPIEGPNMVQSNYGSTFISKYPITVSEVHSISLTKMTDEVFDWLIRYDTTDEGKPEFDPMVHKFTLDTSNYGKKEVSVKDFFTDVANPTVKKMLRQSIGGGGGADTYYSSITFRNYVKDYEE